MADNEKQLKITSIYDSRGAEKVQKVTEDLRKVYDQLGKTIKDVTRGLQDLESVQKRRVDGMSKETDQLRQQVEQLKALRQAHLGVTQTFGGYNNGYRTQGASPTGYANQTTYGKMPASSGRGFSQGVDTNPYAAAPQQPGAGLMMAAKVLGLVGAGVGMVGGAVGAVGGYMQHSGHAEAHEKTMGLENLARSSGYRNHVFMESRSSPIGYSSLKASQNFNLRTKNSGKSSVNELGEIVGPGEAGNQNISGGALQGSVTNMTGEMREHNGKIVSGYGQVIGAAGKALSGGGMIAGGLAGAATGAALGSVVPGLGTAVGGAVGGALGAVAGAGGVGVIISAIKEGTAAMFSIHHEEKKLREGEMEAKQSEVSVSADKMKDEIMAITRYQMGVMNSLAPMESAGGRSSLGNVGYAFGQTDFDKGDALGITTGAVRGFGRAGKKGLGSIFDATRRGMDSGAATSVVGAFGAGGGDGGKQLERIMAVAVKNGMESIDMGFFEKLAVASAKGAYSSSSGRVGTGTAAMLFAGGRPRDQHDVSERQGGIAAGDRLFTENSYFRSRGMVDAAGILGSGAEGAQISALSGASMGELMGGKNSERLSALGISGEQMGAYRNKRINNLGDVMGGYKKVKGLMGGQDFSTYLQSLAGRLKNKKTHGDAYKNELSVLAAYGGQLTGEQFGDMRGMLQNYGVSDKDLGGMASGGGGMGGFGRLGGAGAGIVSTGNRMQNEDNAGGKAALGDMGAAEDKMNNAEFLKHLSGSKHGKNLASQWEKGGKSRSSAAAGINSEYNIFEGRAAAGTSGYGSTQDLNAALGITAKYLENEVSKALANFVKGLNKTAAEVRAYDRAGGSSRR